MIETKTEDILVVKLGGGEGLMMAASCDDLAALVQKRPIVIVHGVSAAANRLCEVRGVPLRTISSPGGHSSRYTDPKTRDIFVEAAEQVNRELVDCLRARGVKAVGLTGEQTVIRGQRKDALRAVVDGRIRVIHDDYSGSITGVAAGRLQVLLAEGHIPVIPPMAMSEGDGLLNIDGDRASAVIAAALGARDLIILSNVRGLYRNFPQEDSFVPQVPASQIENALNWAQGRMKRKVLGAQEAIERGVQRVIVGDGRVQHPVRRALSGEGTVFVR